MPDDLVGGHRRRRLRDRAAVAGEAHVLDDAVVVDRSWTFSSSPHSGLMSSNSRSASSSSPQLCGLLVVLEDLLAVQVVHR